MNSKNRKKLTLLIELKRSFCSDLEHKLKDGKLPESLTLHLIKNSETECMILEMVLKDEKND